MLEKVVHTLGARVYARSIEPLARHAVYRGAVLGFDTEYVSGTRRLLSYQLWYQGRGLFVPCRRLTVDALVRDSYRLIGDNPGSLLLVTYFSLAELQFFDVKGAAVQVREFARGSLDAQFIPARYRGVDLEVYDLARWYDFSSLAKAAESCGMKKLEWDTKHVTLSDVRKKKFRNYALNDARLAHDIFWQLRNQFQQKGVDIVTARTPASASASVFRLHHVRARLYCDNNAARRAACLGDWGGRAEAFQRGVLPGRYIEYDLKSAYPSAAVAIGVFPCQGSWKELSSVKAIEKAAGGFVRCRFQYPAGTQYPGLPVPAKDGAGIYPLSGVCWATTYEVALAARAGAAIQILEAWGYQSGTPILADYMNECLAQRAKATGAARTMWKLLGNSIIGKFAQHTDRVHLSALFDLAEKSGDLIEDLCGMSWDELRVLGEEYNVRLERLSLGSVWMPEWNGLITGYTRARLASALACGGAVYCHTDSLWCRADCKCPGPAWESKTEGRATVIRTRFAGLWGEKEKHIAHHSVWSQAVAEQMLEKFRGDTFSRKYPKSRPLKFREAVKRRDTVGRWLGEGDKGYWHTADTRWCGKRELLTDGTTRPWNTVDDYDKYRDNEKKGG